MSQISWQDQINQVFDARPRDGTKVKNWLTREEEKPLELEIKKPYRHICVDGPSGTGKSSLALTCLARAKSSFVAIQTTKNMSWEEFCRCLIKKPERRITPKVGFSAKGGLQSGLPNFEGQVSLEVSEAQGKDIEEIAKTWTEADACHAMVNQNVSLLIDDFERASPELIVRLSDMAKLLIQTYTSPSSKLIYVGTDDIYRKLIDANHSLEGRLNEITVGSFPQSKQNNAPWAYLSSGFKLLSLDSFPGSENRRQYLIKQANSKLLLQTDLKEHAECLNATHIAANGLPKSLTELGYNIVADITPDIGRTISATRIVDKANEMLKNKISRVKKGLPDLRTQLKKNSSVKIVLHGLLDSGAGKIFNQSILTTEFSALSSDELSDTIGILVSANLLVQTGSNNETIFFKDLTFAHTLRMLMADPKLCEENGLNPRLFSSFGQIHMPIFAEPL